MTLDRKLEDLRAREVDAPHYAVEFCRVRVTRGLLEGKTGKVVRVLFDGTAWVWMDQPYEHPEGGKRFHALGATSALEIIAPPQGVVLHRTKQKAEGLPVQSAA